MWKPSLVILALVSGPVFASNDDGVCAGEDLAFGDDVEAGIEDMFCLVAVFESNKTLHEGIMMNCCLGSEPFQAPPMMGDRDMLCLQVCMVENGEKQKSNETKLEALQDFASCAKEHGDSSAYKPKNMICQNGPGPLPEGDDSANNDGDNDNDESGGDSEEEEDSDQITGDNVDEDEPATAPAIALLNGLLVLGVSIASWQVLG